MVRSQGVSILRVIMVTASIDFSRVNQMGSYLIFDMPIKCHCDNEQMQIAQGNSGTGLYYVLTKGWLVVLAPDKLYILKLNIRKHELS